VNRAARRDEDRASARYSAALASQRLQRRTASGTRIDPDQRKMARKMTATMNLWMFIRGGRMSNHLKDQP
jgi:hypothetical protein